MKLRVSRQIARAAGVLLLLEGSPALSDVLPGSTMPEQVSRALTEQAPQPAPQALPPLEEKKEETPIPLSEEAKKIKFKLNNIILEGNHVYSNDTLRLIYKKQLNTEITLEELFKIVQNITNFYRNSGYILSRAILPPQHVQKGVVKVRIIEGLIDKVTVSGKPGGAQCLIQAMGDNIRKNPPLQIREMEKYLLLANEIPGATVRAVLSASKKKSGASDLTLATEFKPVSGYMTYDNYGTRYIGPQQISANITVNSAYASGDSVRGTMTKSSKGAELTYADVNYTLPIYDKGNRWQFGATNTHTRPEYVLTPTKIDGVNQNYYTMFQMPMIRTRSKNLTARTGFNYLDSRVTSVDLLLYRDHIRSLDIGATYNFADRYYGANLISGDFRQGLPIFDYTGDTNPDTSLTSRPGGHAVYTKFAAQASRQQLVKGNFSLYGLISGQYAFNALLSSEQYTWGGSILGRGYDPAELIGDKGLGGSLEARYNLSIEKFYINSVQLYAFYDIGGIWNILVNQSSPAKVSATSTGFGARLFMTKYVSGNFMWAQPLTKQVAAEKLIGRGKRPRVFFSVVASL